MYCPRFLGVYTRKRVITSGGICYNEFPIVRFRCRETGKRSPDQDKTFSLLPYELFPYVKYSIDFVFDILKSLYVDDKSQKEVLDYINMVSGGELCPEQSIFVNFKSCIIESIDKLLALKSYKELKVLLNQKNVDLRISSLLNYIICRYGCPIRGPCELSYDFYEKNGNYKENSPFLFGTPSQYRF